MDLYQYDIVKQASISTVKNSRNSVKQQGSALLWSLVFIVGLSGIAWTATQVIMPRFEKKQRSLVLRALADVNRDPVSMRIEGLTATLRGEVIDEWTRKAMIDTLDFRTGVLHVNSFLRVMEQGEPYQEPPEVKEDVFDAFSWPPAASVINNIRVPLRLVNTLPPPAPADAWVESQVNLHNESPPETPAGVDTGTDTRQNFNQTQVSISEITPRLDPRDGIGSDATDAANATSTQNLAEPAPVSAINELSDSLQLEPGQPGEPAGQSLPAGDQSQRTSPASATTLQQALDALPSLLVRFDFASDVLTPSSTQVLDRIADVLIAWPDLPVSIEGHTDSTGDAADNMALSLARAVSVRTYLVQRGVPVQRLQAKGFGEQTAIATNATAQGRATNRRIEFNF